jgi:hypothetical protein
MAGAQVTQVGLGFSTCTGGGASVLFCRPLANEQRTQTKGRREQKKDESDVHLLQR